MSVDSILKGVGFALSAAALNATIGALSKILMSSGFSASSVAAIKTILGFLIICGVLPFLKKPKRQAKWTQGALCAFLGIFVLFYFETSAYKHYSAAGVVVILMASASLSSIALGRIFLKDPITLNATLGAALAILGIAVIFNSSFHEGFSIRGALLAAIAGSGYGAFSVAMKRMNVSGGLHFTRQLLFFGSFYLMIPAATDGFIIAELSLTSIVALLGLAILPTVLGFFCTTKAIEYLKPSQVQAVELTEPLFAAIFAYLLVKEIPQDSTYLGAALIVLGLCFSNELIKFGKNRSARDALK